MDVIHQFTEYLVENGIAPKIIESYVRDVRTFVAYLAGMGVGDPTDLKRFYIASYKNHLTEQKYAVPTVNKKINSLQAFNLFLIERKLQQSRSSRCAKTGSRWLLAVRGK